MRKINYCCDRFNELVRKKMIILKKTNSLPTWFIHHKLESYHCPFCGKYLNNGIVIEEPHFDFSSSPKKELIVHIITNTKELKSRIKYCCPRFKNSVKEGKFTYAYKYNKGIDETQWIIPGWYHLYYCPFCGKYIKGKGFGVAPKH